MWLEMQEKKDIYLNYAILLYILFLLETNEIQ